MADKQRASRKQRGKLASTTSAQRRSVMVSVKDGMNSSSAKEIGGSFVLNEFGHDILHGSAKSAIYNAVTKRLRSTG